MAELAMLKALAETPRINGLLDEVAPVEPAMVSRMPDFPVPMVNSAPSLKRWSVGTLPLTRFLGGVNWTNAADHKPTRPEWCEAEDESDVEIPLEKRTLPTGAVPLRAFLTAVNWTNATVVPSLPTFNAPGVARSAAGGQTVENFFGGFSFE